MTPKSLSEWSTAGLRLFGMIGLVACFVVWVVTPDHIVEPLFVTVFGGLLAVGQGADALGELRRPPAPPIPPADPPALEEELKV
jgi:hypothetical protein